MTQRYFWSHLPLQNLALPIKRRTLFTLLLNMDKTCDCLNHRGWWSQCCVSSEAGETSGCSHSLWRSSFPGQTISRENYSTSQQSNSKSQPLVLKKLKLTSSKKTYKTFLQHACEEEAQRGLPPQRGARQVCVGKT